MLRELTPGLVYHSSDQDPNVSGMMRSWAFCFRPLTCGVSPHLSFGTGAQEHTHVHTQKSTTKKRFLTTNILLWSWKGCEGLAQDTELHRALKSSLHRHLVEFMTRVKGKIANSVEVGGCVHPEVLREWQGQSDDKRHWLYFHATFCIGASEFPKLDNTVVPLPISMGGREVYVPRPLADVCNHVKNRS